jgi:hypothetical protein
VTDGCVGGTNATDGCVGGTNATDGCVGGTNATDGCVGGTNVTDGCVGGTNATDGCVGGTNATDVSVETKIAKTDRYVGIENSNLVLSCTDDAKGACKAPFEATLLSLPSTLG